MNNYKRDCSIGILCDFTITVDTIELDGIDNEYLDAFIDEHQFAKKLRNVRLMKRYH